MALIRKIAVQAYKTFSVGYSATELSAFNQNLTKLRDLMCHLTARDLNFDENLVRGCSNKFDPDCGLAPVTYIDIWRDETFSMGIFVLKPGTRLPMHDHPQMHGLIRVIHGCMNVCSYTLLDRDDKRSARSKHLRLPPTVGQTFSARLLSDASPGDRVDANSEALVLTPTEGNIHEIKAVDCAAAFFDILAPPYDEIPDGYRQCNYYREISRTDARPSDTVHRLVCIPPPDDYWTDSAIYSGPAFDPYDKNVTV